MDRFTKKELKNLERLFKNDDWRDTAFEMWLAQFPYILVGNVVKEVEGEKVVRKVDTMMLLSTQEDYKLLGEMQLRYRMKLADLDFTFIYKTTKEIGEIMLDKWRTDSVELVETILKLDTERIKL